MRVQMVVTDVARMRSGVCIAGCTVDNEQSIRPVLVTGGGIPWRLLRPSNDTVVEPFSLIEIDLRRAAPEAPHTEDFVIDGTGNIQIVGSLAEPEIHNLLGRQDVTTVNDIFGAEIVNRRFVRPGTGTCSLGTVTVNQVSFIELGDNQYGNEDYRITIVDASGARYRLRATDIAFCRFAGQLRETLGNDQQAGMTLRQAINRANALYLRIGLSRSFKPRDDREPGCYLIVTGIYSFPSYLPLAWSAYYPSE